MEANPPAEPLCYAEWSAERLEHELALAKFFLDALKQQNIEFEQRWRSETPQ